MPPPSDLICFLRCSKKSHPDILLPNLKRIVVGRSPLTEIKDRRCSREQIALVADYENFTVRVEQVGANDSITNGSVLGKGGVVFLRHGDTLEIISGIGDRHEILFDPPPPPKKEKSSPSPSPSKSILSSPTREKTVVKRKISETGNGRIKRMKLDLKDLRVKVIKKSEGFTWKEIDGGSLYFMSTDSCLPREKIAAYDLDGTLITTASGRVFGRNMNDWKILYSEVPGKLKSLANEDGYKIVVFTNQAGIAKGKVKLEDFMVKIERIGSKLGVPFQLLAAVASDSHFRKPRTGLWDYLVQNENGGKTVNMEASFYVGDAAGRQKDWLPGKKKDFSISDRLFALNLGLPFFTPEEHFLNQKPTSKFQLPEFDPKSVSFDTPLLDPSDTKLFSDKQEVVMLVGMQGSGKSFIAEEYFEKNGYVVASNDRSGSREKSLSILDKALKQGKSVVIDNTHPEPETRKKYLDVTRANKVPCRCFLMNVSPEQARHNILFRQLTGSDHAKINEILLNQFKSKYKKPTLEEGFSSVVKVNFVPKFKNEDEEVLYRMYLQEK